MSDWSRSRLATLSPETGSTPPRNPEAGNEREWLVREHQVLLQSISVGIVHDARAIKLLCPRRRRKRRGRGEAACIVGAHTTGGVGDGLLALLCSHALEAATEEAGARDELCEETLEREVADAKEADRLDDGGRMPARVGDDQANVLRGLVSRGLRAPRGERMARSNGKAKSSGSHANNRSPCRNWDATWLGNASGRDRQRLDSAERPRSVAVGAAAGSPGAWARCNARRAVSAAKRR
eukprot:CAMPEP_0177328616 /NCGR_PEP_ID=MMETSP0368-20130122/19529_1 /TAXON_ID=447022 ORGANISM="Scrippsiella hangoei-like, Strain SHHI-4" /NCGR_SAMPLE_ID=MMETSP0368 /ASSEMBLY_ACC=CAM_ASM_000363 /LENGTH=237 /DNA_ID=CAMNT_0018788777 /DNA_START=374 /DNA_END=1084 /DNA_ORIENTATION=+